MLLLIRIAAAALGAVAIFVAGASTAATLTNCGAVSAQADVAALLTRSANAWNHGDLDTFMQTYENSPQTTYVSATKVVRGYAAIRARYAGHYQPGQMGMLGVSDLVVRPLGTDYAVATARWHLARTKAKGGDVGGLFTLVLHRNAQGWHIITDHTP